jgi:hypothetical protein
MWYSHLILDNLAYLIKGLTEVMLNCLVSLFYPPLYEVIQRAISGNMNAEDPDLLSHNLPLTGDEASLGTVLGPTVKVSNASEVCTQNALPPSTRTKFKGYLLETKTLLIQATAGIKKIRATCDSMSGIHCPSTSFAPT